MKNGNYYLKRDNLTGEVIYLDYEKIKGYDLTPKTNIEDAIRVNKIIMVNPGLSEKLITKKIEIKIRYLLKKLQEFDEDPSGGDEGDVQNTLMDAEKLKVMLLNNYVKYLGNTYGALTLNKIQTIINRLNEILIKKANIRNYYMENDGLYYLDEEEPKKGRGR